MGFIPQYVINLVEAKTVRQVFQWIGIERLSIGEACRRLTEAGIPTRTGKAYWDRSVIWGMLQNPAYTGKAAFGKTKAGELKPRVRPQKHSAETPKKPYSTHRTQQEDWIVIPVPPIINESLFQAVQQQLDENRKRSRIGKRGASYLLQALTVCGHCHYAYYGKKVSSATAKGKQPYAYYRCTGTDAFRFGGERICDNKQVRTERLDEVVWDQVLQAIRHPDRLKKEYENRLSKMEKDTQIQFDTTVLKKQQTQLEKGKSRLIDSYASGLIDKEEFEPRIRQIKTKQAQLEEQIAQTINSEQAHYELFLVINRLEEFAKQVEAALESLDFKAKREIIRTLVKRIEIYKEEVVVIFRIDPELPSRSDNSVPSSTDGNSIMHDCKRSDNTPLGCPLFTRLALSVR